MALEKITQIDFMENVCFIGNFTVANSIDEQSDVILTITLASAPSTVGILDTTLNNDANGSQENKRPKRGSIRSVVENMWLDGWSMSLRSDRNPLIWA